MDFKGKENENSLWLHVLYFVFTSRVFINRCRLMLVLFFVVVSAELSRHGDDDATENKRQLSSVASAPLGFPFEGDKVRNYILRQLRTELEPRQIKYSIIWVIPGLLVKILCLKIICFLLFATSRNATPKKVFFVYFFQHWRCLEWWRLRCLQSKPESNFVLPRFAIPLSRQPFTVHGAFVIGRPWRRPSL